MNFIDGMLKGKKLGSLSPFYSRCNGNVRGDNAELQYGLYSFVLAVLGCPQIILLIAHGNQKFYHFLL